MQLKDHSFLFELVDKFRSQDFRLMTKYIENPTKFSSNAQKLDPVIDLCKVLYPEFHIKEALYLAKNHIESPPVCPSCGERLLFKTEPTLHYPKYCNTKCKLNHKGANNSEKVIVEGTEFPSISDAAKSLGVDFQSVKYKILSQEYPEYRYSILHEETCRKKIEELHPDFLNKEMLIRWKNDRKTIKELAEKYNIKTHSTVKSAFAYHGISTEFKQLSEYAIEKLSDESWFTKEYKKGGSPRVASLIGCSESTALNKAGEYQLHPIRGKSEIECRIEDWLISLGETVISNKKKFLGGKREIDLYIPERKFGIEFDGVTFHCENGPYPKPKNHHSSHADLCSEYGITCMRFTDAETITKLPLVKSMISAKLGKSEKVIYSRKCNIVDVKSYQARKFFDDNHISGFASAKYYIGLEYQGELVFCMSFGKPRFRKNYDWEIIRLASKMNSTVVGGAKRVFSHFKKTHTGESLMTYADLRFGTGEIYKKLGMALIDRSPAGYCYYKNNIRYSRFQFQGDTIKRMCPIYDSTLDELQNATMNGYLRYHDCGNLVYDVIL